MADQETHDAIVAVARDYFTAWYDADARRMENALHPALSKQGLLDDRLLTATAEGMVSAAGDGAGYCDDAEGRRLEIRVIAAHNDIAAVEVRAARYVEYLHLVRQSGSWRIINTLWCRP